MNTLRPSLISREQIIRSDSTDKGHGGQDDVGEGDVVVWGGGGGGGGPEEGQPLLRLLLLPDHPTDGNL